MLPTLKALPFDKSLMILSRLTLDSALKTIDHRFIVVELIIPQFANSRELFQNRYLPHFLERDNFVKHKAALGWVPLALLPVAGLRLRLRLPFSPPLSAL